MGGCCCCCWFSSRRSEPARTPTYYYCPRTSEERQPLSADHGTPAGISGQQVDTNLDTSDPDTYTPPPAPLPYDVDFGHPRTPHGTRDYPGAKSGIIADIAHSSSIEAPINADPSGNLEMGLKDTDGKVESMLELTSSMILEDDLKKPIKAIVAVIEEDCPICLEDYTEENPKLLTKCDHHFHLCCILEWMERSDACPVCDQVSTLMSSCFALPRDCVILEADQPCSSNSCSSLCFMQEVVIDETLIGT
ncbi:hypothetical protein KSS87_001407 [Heliosperma pusillum]|nr:hypothetical protein KSS87_001407 [Heliosperma pusillum]